MTIVEILVSRLSKTEITSLDDYVTLMNKVVIVKKKFMLLNNASAVNVDTVLKNYKAVATRKNKQLANILRETYNMFDALGEHDVFVKYIIWWTYTVYKDKLFKKYTSSDILNDTLLKAFTDWLTTYINNINVLTEFYKSYTFVAAKCINNKKAEEVLRELVASDKLSVAYMTGQISLYVLATIPGNVLGTFDLKRNVFSSQLFNMISNTREYLLGILNQAVENIIKTPVDFISFVNEKCYNKSV